MRSRIASACSPASAISPPLQSVICALARRSRRCLRGWRGVHRRASAAGRSRSDPPAGSRAPRPPRRARARARSRVSVSARTSGVSPNITRISSAPRAMRLACREHRVRGAAPLALLENLAPWAQRARASRATASWSGPDHHGDVAAAGLRSPRRAHARAACGRRWRAAPSAGRAHAGALAGRQHDRKASSSAHRDFFRSRVAASGSAEHCRQNATIVPLRQRAMPDSANVFNDVIRVHRGSPWRTRYQDPESLSRSTNAVKPLRRNPLWRLLAWGGAACLALVAVAARRPDRSRQQTAAASSRRASAPSRRRVARSLPRAERKAAPRSGAWPRNVRELAADRDRLTARIAALEHNLEDMTGSIKQQCEQLAHAARSAACMPAAMRRRRPASDRGAHRRCRTAGRRRRLPDHGRCAPRSCAAPPMPPSRKQSRAGSAAAGRASPCERAAAEPAPAKLNSASISAAPPASRRCAHIGRR